MTRDLCCFCRKRVTCKHRKSLQGIPDLFIAECNGKRIETQDERKERIEREYTLAMRGGYSGPGGW